MSIFNFITKKLAKGPAIIGTIDTVAKHYIKIKNDQPNLEDSKIYADIIQQRYSLMPLSDKSEYNILVGSVPKIQNVKELIFRILCAETELVESGDDFRKEVLKVIGDELKNKYNIE